MVCWRHLVNSMSCFTVSCACGFQTETPDPPGTSGRLQRVGLKLISDFSKEDDFMISSTPTTAGEDRVQPPGRTEDRVQPGEDRVWPERDNTVLRFTSSISLKRFSVLHLVQTETLTETFPLAPSSDQLLNMSST